MRGRNGDGAVPGQVRRWHAGVGAGGVSEAAERPACGRWVHHVRGVQAARGPGRQPRHQRNHRLRHVRQRLPRQVSLTASRRVDKR